MAKHEYRVLEPVRNPVGSAYRSFAIALQVCTWAVCLFLAYHYRSQALTAVVYTYEEVDNRVYECGDTVSEAIRLGCEFDPVSFAWLPERCLDRELAAQLTSQTNWTLHADPDGKLPKSDMAFASNESATYISNSNHILHCLYSWRRLHRMILSGKPYHSGLSYGHTVHCTETVLDAVLRPPNDIRNEALVIMPAC